MKVLIACEFSGVTRDAFAERGHYAWSCDLLPSETPGNHIQCDHDLHLFDIIRDGNWDLLIAHPPCTYLSWAATKYWNQVGREEKRQQALRFLIALFNSEPPRICIENPVGFPNSVWKKPNQIIEPFFFGESQRKRTCLWLKRLPPLIHSKESDLFFARTHTDPPSPIYVDKSGKKRFFTDALHGGYERSRSFRSIAKAMAEQWGQL